MAEDTIKDEEYAPITKGLREYIERHPTMMHAVGLTDLLDNIDALHKALEEQNAKLHEKVLNQRKQLAEVQEAIERRNNGVLKRRWQKKMDALKKENEKLCDFIHRVREAIRRHEDLTLWGTDYTALPLDADGVPIHVEDDMQSLIKPATHGMVYRIELTRDGWWIYFKSVGMRPENCRHYHKSTVTDMLHQFLDECENAMMRGYSEVPQEVFDNYVKLLQLAEVEE